MKVFKLDNFHRGWIAGACFDNKLIDSDIEVAIQYYNKGDVHERHFHKSHREVNIICSGKCEFDMWTWEDKDQFKDKKIVELNPKDIIIIYPYEICQLRAITDCCLAVIKTASIKGDKYLI